MANTVLGKVCPVPRGDYSASATYYALDIAGYNGGSYLAMKEVTGVTPSNDQINWMQLSGPGLPGVDGVTFTPSVSEAGEISWTNDGDKENPDPVNIMGPTGAAAGFGTVTATADNTSSETPSVDVQSSGPDTAKNFTFAFSGLKGNPGETPDIEIGTVNTLEPGQDATADITGTTPNLTLSLGIPKGQPGTSVSRVERTSGTGAAGTTDTYTMYDSNDDAIGTFTVYNGANGAGAGDMMADGSVPMTGPLNMGGNKITNLGAPGSDTDAVRKSDLDAVAAEVDGILDGTTPAHLSPATDTKIGGVIIGEGLSVEADGTVSADDQLPTGGTQGQVLTQGTTGPEWQDAPSGLPDGGTTGQVLTQGASGPVWSDAPDPLPTGGETGQVLTKTAGGTAWDDVPSDLPSGGTDGQVLTKTADGVAWEDAPDTGVTSFNSRTGAVTPQEGDYTADMVGARPDTWTPSAADVGAVPTSRTVNGQELSQDINLTADNVGARPSTWTPTASDVGAIPNPTGGTTGQILEKTATGTQWADKPSSGMTQGEADQRYLQLSGGTMTGGVNFGPDGAYIKNVYKAAGDSLVLGHYSEGQSGGPTLELNQGGVMVCSNGGLSVVASFSGSGLSMSGRPITNCPSIIAPPTRLTAVLSASGWSGNSQTITVNGVVTNTSAQDIDIACADKASADAWAAGGVWCSNPTTANQLTFTCTTAPTANINLNIRLWEVG